VSGTAIELTQAEVRRLLDYDPETGVFTWLVSAGRVRAGGAAGSMNRGYREIRIDRRNYAAHRLAWLYMTGERPSHEIDHINGDPGDNRIINLRPATSSQNKANARKRSRNTSGWKGVSWHARDRKWRAMIGVAGRQQHLGYFDCPAEAHAAYVRAAEHHFGEFARTV
jgi:hypothetical protein